jgi:hypothetical protein
MIEIKGPMEHHGDRRRGKDSRTRTRSRSRR